MPADFCRGVDRQRLLEGDFDLGILDLFDHVTRDPRLDLAGFDVDLGVDVSFLVVLARGRRNRLGDSVDQGLGLDVAFRGHLPDEHVDVELHERAFPSFMIEFQSTSRRASKISSIGSSISWPESSKIRMTLFRVPIELADDGSVIAERRCHADLDAMADVALVIVALVELAVETGRGHLEGVVVADRVLDIQHRRRLTRNHRTLVEVDAVRAVNHQAQNGLRPGAHDLGRDQLEPLVRHDGGELILYWLFQLHISPRCRKKSGPRAHFPIESSSGFYST